jgi:glycosyltransferase domain-containing protein
MIHAFRIYGKQNMSKLPLISVVVPTHNRPEFLEKTLKSILSQSYKNLEIIIVSNGINKQNLKTALKFQDARIRYYEQDNSGGPASPRNHGIKKSNGKYVAFCDDDDLWMPDKIEKQVFILEKNPKYGLCYTKMIRFNEFGEESIISTDKKDKEEKHATFNSMLYINDVPISSVMIRKSLINKYGNFLESKKVGNSEDYEFLLRHILMTKFYLIDEYLIKYWNGNNRTSSTSPKVIDIIRYVKTIFSCHSIIRKSNNLDVLTFLMPSIFHIKDAVRAIAYTLLNKHIPSIIDTKLIMAMRRKIKIKYTK